MNYISGSNRNQMQFFALEELVAQDSWARVVDLFVDLLPLQDLGFKHSSLQKEGRPPYDPSILLKLYLYGYKQAIRSSRRLEHACKVNIELWWLLKGLKPSFRSIAYFRKDNAPALKAAFRFFVIMLQDLDLIEGETIAIDSFKIRAQNNIRKNYNQAKIDRHIDYIDTKIEQYEQELEKADIAEKEELKAKIVRQTERRKKYEQIEEQLTNAGGTQISTTDPDAKAMRANNNGTDAGYLIQAAVDARHKIFVHAETAGEVTDKRALSPMALEVKHLLDLKGFKLLSDAGYSAGDQFQICKANGIETYCAPMPSTSPSQDCIPTSEFIYDKANDYYICPSGNIMNRALGNGTLRQNYKAFIYKTPACKTCSIRQDCTKNKQGRVIERTEYQDVIDENRERVFANKDYYKLRQQIAEHQFGVIKRQWGFSFTLLKGKTHVMSEINLLMMAYNLSRAIAILGLDAFRNRVERFWADLLRYIKSFENNFKALFRIRYFLLRIPRLKFANN